MILNAGLEDSYKNLHAGYNMTGSYGADDQQFARAGLHTPASVNNPISNGADQN